MLLLDTCTLIWLSTDVTHLSECASGALNDPTRRLFVSAISAWELGIGVSKRRVQLDIDPRAWFARSVSKFGIEILDISSNDALRSTELPWIHRDPADRIIIATALSRQLTVVSPDEEIPKYPGLQVLW